MIAILLLALSFPQNPQPGQIWHAPSGHTYHVTDAGVWELADGVICTLNSNGVDCDQTCPPAYHYHPRNMDTSQPDVKGGPLPKADGKCHKDLPSDERVK